MPVEEMPSVASCQRKVVRVQYFLADATSSRARWCWSGRFLRGWTGLGQSEEEVGEESMRARLRRHVERLLCVGEEGCVLPKKVGVGGPRCVCAEDRVGRHPFSARGRLYEAAEVLWRRHPDLSKGSGDGLDWVRWYCALYQYW